jgi:hypothetical protein
MYYYQAGKSTGTADGENSCRGQGPIKQEHTYTCNNFFNPK